MKILYLGSGAAEAIPGVFCACDLCNHARRVRGKNVRTRSQVLVNDRLIIDFGPDAYSHSLSYGVDFSQINSILITHSHSDHFTPAEFEFAKDGIFSYNRKCALNVLGNDKIGTALSPYKFKPSELNFVQLTAYKTVTAEGLSITPLPANHAENENALIYLIEDECGKTLLYGNDTGMPHEEIFDFLEKRAARIDILSLDCTNGAFEREYSHHMSLRQNALVFEKLQKRGVVDELTVCVCTHFSHNCKMTHDELVDAAAKHGFIVAHDGKTVEL